MLCGFLLLWSILIILNKPLVKNGFFQWDGEPQIVTRQIVVHPFPWIHPFKTSWWLNQPIWKNMQPSIWGSFPQGSGWKVPKIFELPPPCVVNFAYDLKRKMDEHGKLQGSSLKLISPGNCLPCSQWLIHLSKWLIIKLRGESIPFDFPTWQHQEVWCHIAIWCHGHWIVV